MRASSCEYSNALFVCFFCGGNRHELRRTNHWFDNGHLRRKRTYGREPRVGELLLAEMGLLKTNGELDLQQRTVTVSVVPSLVK